VAISKIEQELLDICGLPAYNPDGDRQAFLRELSAAVDKLEDDAWNRLSPAAQNWQYDAGAAIDALLKDPASPRELPDFAEAAPAAAEPPIAAESAQAEETTDMPRAAIASKTNGRVPAKTLKEVRTQLGERRRPRNRPPVPPQPRSGPTRTEQATQQQAKRTARGRVKPPVLAPKKKPTKPGESVPEVIMRAVIKDPDIDPGELFELVDKKTKATRESPELKASSVNAIAYNTRRVLGHIKDLRKTNKNLDIDRH
jgi:hypothetical protein